jgi:hypothetical protein
MFAAFTVVGDLLLGLLHIVLLLIVSHGHHLHHFPNHLLVRHILLLELKLVLWVLGLELGDIVVSKLRQELLLHVRLLLLLLLLLLMLVNRRGHGWGHEVNTVWSSIRCLRIANIIGGAVEHVRRRIQSSFVDVRIVTGSRS